MSRYRKGYEECLNSFFENENFKKEKFRVLSYSFVYVAYFKKQI